MNNSIKFCIEITINRRSYLTLVVISCEIYGAITSARFVCFQWDFIALKVDIISTQNTMLSRTAS